MKAVEHSRKLYPTVCAGFEPLATSIPLEVKLEVFNGSRLPSTGCPRENCTGCSSQGAKSPTPSSITPSQYLQPRDIVRVQEAQNYEPAYEHSRMTRPYLGAITG